MNLKFSDYVVTIRRDLSAILVPKSVYFSPSYKVNRCKNESGIVGYDCAFVDSDDFDNLDTCNSDLASSPVTDREIALNNSINGYNISGRSKQAIRNCANSLFFRSENKLNLRFVTFTFPSLPQNFETKVEEDKFLHQLFLKFLKNEKNNYGLKSWLWVNERQSGERLRDDKEARQVLHYHCIFDYCDSVNYRVCNLRFLRLLLRNGFEVMSSTGLSYNKGSAGFEAAKKAYNALKNGNYNYFHDPERMYYRDKKTGIKKFLFLCPVDFEKLKINTLDIQKVSSYVSKYISKSEDKIYCRRWGSSQGLSLNKEIMENFVNSLFIKTEVDTETGELTELKDHVRMFNFMTLGDKQYKMLKFNIDVGSKKENIQPFIYVPPNWAGWASHSAMRKLFKDYFGYNF